LSEALSIIVVVKSNRVHKNPVKNTRRKREKANRLSRIPFLIVNFPTLIEIKIHNPLRQINSAPKFSVALFSIVLIASCTNSPTCFIDFSFDYKPLFAAEKFPYNQRLI